MVTGRLLSLMLVLIGLAGCSKPDKAGVNSSSAGSNSSSDLTQLFGRIWQLTATGESAPGSIYIFLANGTLLETSCVETYRIATWTIDPKAPSVLRVTEDKQPAFTAVITGSTPNTLQLRQTLVRSNLSYDLTLNAIDREFVCPDLPR
jgi:hypothetical protein